MNDGVATLRGLREREWIRHVADARLDAVVARVTGVHEVEDLRHMAVREEAIDDVRADETGPAGDQDLHPTVSPTTGA